MFTETFEKTAISIKWLEDRAQSGSLKRFRNMSPEQIQDAAPAIAHSGERMVKSWHKLPDKDKQLALLGKRDADIKLSDLSKPARTWLRENTKSMGKLMRKK